MATAHQHWKSNRRAWPLTREGTYGLIGGVLLAIGIAWGAWSMWP